MRIDKNILIQSMNLDETKSVWFTNFKLSKNVGRCIIDLPPLNAIVNTYSPHGGEYKKLKISNIISGKRNYRPELISYPMFETKEEALNFYNESIDLEIERIENKKEEVIKQFDSYILRAKLNTSRKLK